MATFYLIYGWYNVFPWAIVALIIGYTGKNRRDGIINGAIFGYFLFLVYIYAGYKGRTDTSAMAKFILFDALFSLVGAFAGAIGAFIGNWLKGKIRK
ncbi:hypothetical protein [Mucilaginibacter gotjawali]|uniref:hypothetical protein n=1 Tax=Mucilaginibacter gotjawali TaxID=1550579 RepID=UPI000BBA72C2|nr:hypothetical protein [Mucilaginibacter gotjawali]